MSNRGVAVVGVRLLAVYVFLRVLFMLPEAAEQWQNADQPSGPTTAILLAGLAIGAYLWFRVGVVVDRMLPARTAQSLEHAGKVDEEMPATLIFAGAGALLLAWSLPELLAQALDVYSVGALDFSADVPAMTELAVAGLRVLLGLGMMLGSGGLYRTIRHLRRTGAG